MKLIATLLAVAVAALAGLVWSGAYDVGADEPHWGVTLRLLEAVRERSLTVRARNVQVPADLGDTARTSRGAGNYDAMCAGCHLKPGVDSSEIRKGLYPQPPNLAQAGGDPARQFWVIKHGLKMTGMPAWSLSGVDDGTIWDMVALLQQLPALSTEQYRALVGQSEGHTHGSAGQEHHDAPHTPPHHH